MCASSTSSVIAWLFSRQSAFRVSMKTTGEFFHSLQEAGSAEGWLDRMQTRKELYETLDYDPTAESWRGYSSSGA